jgi:hypothetical protein
MEKREYLDFVDVTSVTELKNTVTSIFPNPSAGQFTVKLQEQSTITVYDVSLKKIFEGNFNAGISEINLNVQKGTYILLEYSVSGNIRTNRLVITE